MKDIVLTGFSDEADKSFDKQLEIMNEFGVKNIELRAADGENVADLSAYRLGEIKGKLIRAGIGVSAIGSPIGKISLTDNFPIHMERFKHTLDIQKELGAPYMRVFSFYVPGDWEPARVQDAVYERMHTMLRTARNWDAVLLHENEKGIYGDNAARCLDLMEQFSGPYFRAVFDFANFVEVGQETWEAYHLLKPFIEYVHIKDCVKATRRIVPAGQGDGHVAEILTGLIGGGWRGYLSLEPHLADFSGLRLLEKDAKERGLTDGKTAWKTALDALKAILKNIPEAQV